MVDLSRYPGDLGDADREDRRHPRCRAGQAEAKDDRRRGEPDRGLDHHRPIIGGEIAEEAIAFVDQPREVPHDERPHRPDQKIKNGVDQQAAF